MEKEVFAELLKIVKNIDARIDARIDSQVDKKILQHFSMKWQIISIVVGGIIASIAVHAVVLTYVNDKIISSNMAKYENTLAYVKNDLDSVKNDLDSVKNDLKILIDSPKKSSIKNFP